MNSRRELSRKKLVPGCGHPNNVVLGETSRILPAQARCLFHQAQSNSPSSLIKSFDSMSLEHNPCQHLRMQDHFLDTIKGLILQHTSRPTSSRQIPSLQKSSFQNTPNSGRAEFQGRGIRWNEANPSFRVPDSSTNFDSPSLGNNVATLFRLLI